MKRKNLSLLLTLALTVSCATLPAGVRAEDTEEFSDGGAAVEFLSEPEMAVGENASQAFAGNTMYSATELAPGSEGAGIITDASDAHWYKLVVPSSGRVTLDLTAKMEYVYYELYYSNGKSFWDDRPIWNEETHQSSETVIFDLLQGEYYFLVSQHTENTGDYSFKYSFESAEETYAEEGEGTDNTMETAHDIEFGSIYKGQIANNDDVDFYRFVMPSSGKISLSAIGEKARYMNFSIYNEKGNELKKWYPYWNITTETIHLEDEVYLTKGTYYFAPSEYTPYTGNYSFSLTFADGEESFGETGSGTNNEIKTASEIALDKEYKGQLALNDDKDYYRFTLKSAQNLTYVMTADGIKSMYTYIYDSNGREVWKKYSYYNSGTGLNKVAEDVKLKEGTYYLAITRNGSNYGNYSFRIGPHTHSWTEKVTKATLSTDGKIQKTCSCGQKTTATIYRPKTIALSAAKYTYDGKEKKPSVKVTDAKGKTISSSNYSISYDSGRKSVGTCSVKVTFKGNYSGTKKLSFTIVPKATSITKVTAKTRGFAVNWKKQTSQTNGYQIQYSTGSKFSPSLTKLITKNSTTGTTLSGLSARRTYYVRIRAYKTVNKTRVYSAWSSVKTVKTR